MASRLYFSPAVMVLACCMVVMSYANGQEKRIFHSRSCSQPCYQYESCPAIYRAGTEANDLQVHVVGKNFDTIEAYFREELFRETLSLTNMHCGRISVAPKNPLGTFAVQLGACGDTIRAYGWKVGEFSPTTKEITPEKGTPLSLTWVTPRILKATYGEDKYVIIRFNDSKEGWTVLSSKPPLP